MSRIWITRSLPGAEQSAAAFKDIGFTPIIAPLLDITAPDIMPEVPPKDAVLIFTSKNAVNAFCSHISSRHWPVVTVGDATAELARSYGFVDIRSANGRSQDISDLISHDAVIQRLYVHISGTHVRGDIIGDLNRQGRQARRDIYYCSAPVKQLPDIPLQDINYAALYSPLAAQTLAGFWPDVKHMSAISLSRDIDRELESLGFAKRYIADSLTQSALLKAAQQCLREGSKTR